MVQGVGTISIREDCEFQEEAVHAAVSGSLSRNV